MTDTNRMTAGQLIEQLKHADPDAEIHITPVLDKYSLSIHKVVFNDDNSKVRIELNETVRLDT